MRRLLAVLLLASLTGCDALNERPPTWAEVGSVAVFDYESGPDSLEIMVVGPDFLGEREAARTRTRAFEMRIRASLSGRATDGLVVWHVVPPPGAIEAFYNELPELPLHGRTVALSDDGLEVVVTSACADRRTSDELRYVWAPRRPGPFEMYGRCPWPTPRSFTEVATGPETVTVPAGRFSAIRVERAGGHHVEWWDWQTGLVRLDVLNERGTLRGRFVRSAGSR